LKQLDFLDRNQLQKIHRLGKVRNTNRVLNDLSSYISSFREEYSTIYYLNKDGREYVGSVKVRRKNQFVQHVLIRNDFYIYARMPGDWQNEVRIKNETHSVICDAYFKTKGRYHFLEVDLHQKMSENRKKINEYKQLKKSVEERLGYFPQLIWITTTELRRKQLQVVCEGLPSVVFTREDIK
jgi:hypothetical protein